MQIELEKRSVVSTVFFGFFLPFFISCSPGELQIQTVPGGEEISGYQIDALTGIRDGEFLSVNLRLISRSSILQLAMSFRIGMPTRLELGEYSWLRDGQKTKGTVHERAVTFLGGQSDRPHLGGLFELLSREGLVQYTIRLPTSEVGQQ